LIECRRRKVCCVGGGNGVELIDSLLFTSLSEACAIIRGGRFRVFCPTGTIRCTDRVKFGVEGSTSSRQILFCLLRFRGGA